MTKDTIENLVRQITHLRIAYQDARRASDTHTATRLARLIAANENRLQELMGKLNRKRS